MQLRPSQMTHFFRTLLRGAQVTIRAARNDNAAHQILARMGHADYNLFYSPRAKSKRNYWLAVAGKAERSDAGFGLNDLPRAGRTGEQAEPMLGAGSKDVPVLRR